MSTITATQSGSSYTPEVPAGSQSGTFAVQAATLSSDASIIASLGGATSTTPLHTMRVQRLVVVLVLMATAGYCWAATMQDAMSAKDRGDFSGAFIQFKQLAASGDAAAQFQLSLLYGTGSGTKQDAKEALYWLRMSAVHGNAQAQSNLGVAFSKGRGVVQDPVRAYTWFAAAAASGDSVAMTNRDIAAKKLTAQQTEQAKALLLQCQSSGFTACL